MSRPSQYDSLEASEMFCPRCRQSRPVRRHLLLVLSTGHRYEYRCSACGASVGGKEDNDASEYQSILRRT
jgi:DNA-directed RNA polymerase subunit RPC12/RpoP